MSATEFLIFYVCVLAVILACRCVPLLTLKGRELSPRVSEALGLIPPAAFAALVANDLFDPSTGPSWTALVAAARSGRGGEKDRVAHLVRARRDGLLRPALARGVTARSARYFG